jgi:hypothetical protein
MRGSILLILVVGFGIIFILRLRQRLSLLAGQIRALRQQALEPLTYRPSTDPELGVKLAKATHEVDQLGFTILGDYIEESSLQYGQSMRWFVDAVGTTFGWMSPFAVGGEQHIVVVLMSHELDGQIITARQPAASLISRPSFVDMKTVPMATSITELFASHKKRAFTDDGALVPIKTFEELEHELARMRDRVIAWRRAQPADELLDADLRSLLGAQYDKLAGPLKRRLANG